MYQSPTTPLSIGGVLDDGFRLLRACFGSVIVLAIIGAVISSIPNFMVIGATPEETQAMVGTMGLLFLLTVPVSLIIFGAIVARIFAVVDGEDMSMGAAIGVGLRRFLPMVFWAILFGIAVMIGSLLLVIPGMILMVSLSFGPYLIVRDGQGPIDAIRNSHRLVWGNWWRTAVLMTIMMFIFSAVYVLAGVIGALGAVAETQASSSGLVSNAIITLATALISPVSYSLWIAIFNDLRLRKEGDDLEQRIGDIEAT